jgi:hypothetical protein
MREKKRRDRLMHQAAQHPNWALGFLDEMWWSRLAQPALYAWTEGKPLHLLERVAAKGDPDPKGFCQLSRQTGFLGRDVTPSPE